MKVLVLGGTRFIGRHLVDRLSAGGHQVTLFNRGQTDPGGVPGVEAVHGDRERDLGALSGRRWDAVVDTCGYVPRVVAASVEALGPAVDRYLFVSTISVYPPDLPAGGTEDAPLVAPPEAGVEEVNATTYGGLKVACERVLTSALGDRATIVRPGLVTGPGDYTDRLTYWAVKLATPGPFAAPMRQGSPVQHVDARDLAGFMATLLEGRRPGTFHVCGPTPPLSFGDLIERGVEALGGVASPVWTDVSVYKELGVQPWSEVPFVSSFDEETDGLFALDNGRAVGAGFVQRPLEETLADTARWWLAERSGSAMKAGLTAERERALLEHKEAAPRP